MNEAAIMASMFGSLAIMWACVAVFGVYSLVCIWRIFNKAGVPGWMYLVPFLNAWKLMTIAGIPGWWSLIPVANCVMLIVAYWKMFGKFGISVGMRICGFFFPLVPYTVVAFNPYIEYDFEG